MKTNNLLILGVLGLLLYQVTKKPSTEEKKGEGLPEGMEEGEDLPAGMEEGAAPADFVPADPRVERDPGFQMETRRPDVHRR